MKPNVWQAGSNRWHPTYSITYDGYNIL